MIFEEFESKLKKRFATEGPAGEDAQYELAPQHRSRITDEEKKRAKHSAVLALAFPVEAQTHLCFIQRNSYKGVHSAQIGFPGGKKEDFDDSLEDTALRETKEEVGVLPGQVELIGQLTELYIPPSNFLVRPFVGLTRQEPVFKIDPREVSSVLSISVSKLFDDRSIVDTEVEVGLGKIKIKTRAFDVDGHIIWGATAMMLSELKAMMV